MPEWKEKRMRALLSMTKPAAISIAAWTLYMQLAAEADEKNSVKASARFLAQRLGISAEYVRKLLVKLETAKMVQRTGNFRDDGSVDSNTYQLLI